MICPVFHHAKHIPTTDALRWSGRSVSWQYLSHYVSSTVRHLKEYGLNRGDVIGLVSAIDQSVIVLMLSLWQMGCVVCFLRNDVHAIKPEDLKEFKFIVVNKKWNSKVKQVILENIVTLEVLKDFWYGSEEASPEWEPTSPAVIIRNKGEEMILTISDILEKSGKPKFLSDLGHSLRTGKALDINSMPALFV